MTRWLWTSPDGFVTDLSDWGAGTYVVADGSTGELAPTYAFATQELAGVDGAAVHQIAADPATPMLALDLVAADPAELRARVRALAHAMRPRRGIGSLTAVDDGGGTRTLPCFYRGGLNAGTYRATRYRTVLEFYAPSPWWRGEPLTYSWNLAAPSTFFPILPIVLSPSTISGAVTLDLSDTDSPTSPLWQVTGPGSQLTLSKTVERIDEDGAPITVTQTLVLTPPGGIGDGRVVTIDTRPTRQAITRDDGVSLFAHLSTDPALWRLDDAVNVVTATLTNAGAASRIELTADRLHSGAR